jgi:hypothetical protein
MGVNQEAVTPKQAWRHAVIVQSKGKDELSTGYGFGWGTAKAMSIDQGGGVADPGRGYGKKQGRLPASANSLLT